MELKEITKQLRTILFELRERYETNEPPQNRRDKQFFAMVKEETLPVYKLLDDWEDLASSAVKQRQVNIHPHQINSAKENMELILLHSYYIDARRKRYMELFQSVKFIFDQIIQG